jgi:nitrogen fixation NifU-like protein
MDELQQLYQEIILDHNRHPRNFGALEHCSHHAEGFNPLCGDRLELFVNVDENGLIENLRFTGKGCAISTASASLMTQHVMGRPVHEVEGLIAEFHAVVTGQLAPEDAPTLGKLKIFSGVSEFPTRVKCATLCWHTLRSALAKGVEPATTE